jgi:hypothetical protein
MLKTILNIASMKTQKLKKLTDCLKYPKLSADARQLNTSVCGHDLQVIHLLNGHEIRDALAASFPTAVCAAVSVTAS